MVCCCYEGSYDERLNEEEVKGGRKVSIAEDTSSFSDESWKKGRGDETYLLAATRESTVQGC